MPSNGSKRMLASSAIRFHRELLENQDGPAFAYLSGERGLSLETIEQFKLGVVSESDEEYGHLAGYLSIPYITPTSPTEWWQNYVDLRFRRGPEMPDTAPKYRTLPGHPTRLFATTTLANPSDYIVIVEGEVDAMTLIQCGIPAVGVPGVKAWKPYYKNIFAGFERVYILADKDEAKDDAEVGVGERFAEEVARAVPNPKVIVVPDGGDTNGFYLKHGAAELRGLIGV
ncbi:toprim domain-containing protein [Brevibacterium sp. CSND-B09]|uniref:toprim domain-containing protein n=1 Tax=Brevibacterium sp. CSND-B09 TaxID=3462571 RepID=UPI00406A6B24